MHYQPHNILVTGGAGFIGSNFIRYLLEGNMNIDSNSNITIINLDGLTYAGSLKNCDALSRSHPNQYSFIQGDICDAALVKNIFLTYEVDTVVHFAAESHVDRSIENATPFVQTNIVGTLTLLDAARAYWQHQKKWDTKHCRFHHVSTDEVYGALTAHEPPFTEKTPYAPNSPYAASKASSDHLVRAYYKTYQLPVTMSHCSNNYGPYQHTEKLIPTIIRACRENQPIPLYGDGKQIRDWLYVDDHCRGIDRIIRYAETGETYHLGGGHAMSNLRVAEYICELMDGYLPKAAPHGRLITFVRDRPGHDWRYAIDTTKIQNQLGWKPKESFATGMVKTCDWYLALNLESYY